MSIWSFITISFIPIIDPSIQYSNSNLLSNSIMTWFYFAFKLDQILISLKTFNQGKIPLFSPNFLKHLSKISMSLTSFTSILLILIKCNNNVLHIFRNYSAVIPYSRVFFSYFDGYSKSWIIEFQEWEQSLEKVRTAGL